MTPTALSIVTTTFGEGAERNKALGVWTTIGGVGATAAWLVGGPITDGLGWEWVFFINVPVAVAVVALSPRLLRESRDSGHGRQFDFAGAVRSQPRWWQSSTPWWRPRRGWADSQTLGLLALSAVLFALFVAIEARSAAPLAPLRVFRSRALVGGNLVLFALGMLAFGMPFILTQYAQGVLHYSALEFGLASVVMPVMAALGSITGQAIATKGGLRRSPRSDWPSWASAAWS